MFEMENFRCPLPDDHAGSHRVTGRYSRHNRSISDPEIVDSIHSQVAIHHRHRISTHLRGAGLVPETCRSIPNKAFEFGPFQITWHYFALDERTQRSGVTDFAAEFYTGDRGFEIIRVRQRVCINQNWVEWIGSRQAQTTSAFGVRDRPK